MFEYLEIPSIYKTCFTGDFDAYSIPFYYEGYPKVRVIYSSEDSSIERNSYVIHWTTSLISVIYGSLVPNAKVAVVYLKDNYVNLYIDRWMQENYIPQIKLNTLIIITSISIDKKIFDWLRIGSLKNLLLISPDVDKPFEAKEWYLERFQENNFGCKIFTANIKRFEFKAANNPGFSSVTYEQDGSMKLNPFMNFKIDFKSFFHLSSDIMRYDIISEPCSSNYQRWWKGLDYFERYAIKRLISKKEKWKKHSRYMNIEEAARLNRSVIDYVTDEELVALESSNFIDLSHSGLRTINNLFSSQSPFKDVEYINLAYNDIKDISILSKFENLNDINLSYNHNIDFWSLKYLNSLEKIDIMGIRQKQLPDIGLTSVRRLNIDYSEIEELNFLKTNNQLEHLSILECQISNPNILLSSFILGISATRNNKIYPRYLSKSVLKELRVRGVQIELYSSLKTISSLL